MPNEIQSRKHRQGSGVDAAIAPVSGAILVPSRVPEIFGGRETGVRDNPTRDYGLRDVLHTKIEIEVVDFANSRARPVGAIFAGVCPVSVFSQISLNHRAGCVIRKYGDTIQIPRGLANALKAGRVGNMAVEPAISGNPKKSSIRGQLADIAVGCAANFVGEKRFLVTRVLVVDSTNDFPHAYLAERDVHAMCSIDYSSSPVSLQETKMRGVVLYTLKDILKLRDAYPAP